MLDGSPTLIYTTSLIAGTVLAITLFLVRPGMMTIIIKMRFYPFVIIYVVVPWSTENTQINLIHHRLGLPCITTEKSMNDWWNRLQITPNHSLTNLVSNKSFQWAPGGIFSVTKNRIHHRPLSFYKNIIDTLDSSSDPITGHYCERAWGYIFNI